MGEDPATWGSASGLVPPGGWTVRRFAAIDSTNRWLLDEARAGAPAGLVAVADHQDAGRGRRGRAWDDEPGSSLLVSVLLRPGLRADRLHVITMAAGVAVAEAVEATTGVGPSLKWPNDLVVRDRKLAGLLTEVDLGTGDAAAAVVVGIGCNVTQRSFAGELAESATSCAIESAHAGTPVVVTRDGLLDAFLDRLGHRLRGIDDVADAYRSRLGTLGRRVRVDLGDATVVGVATDVDETGRLVVETDGVDGAETGPPVAIAVGDVVHLRHPEDRA